MQIPAQTHNFSNNSKLKTQNSKLFPPPHQQQNFIIQGIRPLVDLRTEIAIHQQLKEDRLRGKYTRVRDY